MMQLRKKLGAAALLATAAMVAAGCSGRDDGDDDAGTNGGCTGVCNDGGTDAGSDAGTDAGSTDGGQTEPTLLTIPELRKVKYGTWIKVVDVVVQGIEYEKLSDQNGKDWRSRFWVVDAARPTEGIFVEKFYSDTPTSYHPTIGDKIDIEGYLNTELPYEQFRGYRQRIVNDFKNSKPLKITEKSKVTAPSDNEVTVDALKASAASFSQADAGYAGTRVHVTGNLALTNPTPTAFMRVDSADAGTVFYGFEVDGILVNHENTRDLKFSDGGTETRCDWQAAALDGGGVSFPNGIRGTWDTYTFAACSDGGTDIFNCFRNNGKVPGSTKNYTYAVHPAGCDDLQGVVDAGVVIQ